jgi:peptidoglycan/LPS O-acetylase OafA/YrhL
MLRDASILPHSNFVTARSEQTQSRVAALDITKGVLVVLMVVYHSLNYSADYTLGFKFLAFLPPSFIFITGFLISNIYLARPNARGWNLYRRLIVRGVKLLLLFTLLNVAARAIRGHGPQEAWYAVAGYFRHADEIYLAGNGRLSAFEVLIPIGYLLILSPAVIAIDALHRLLLPLAVFTCLAALAWWERQGGGSANAYFVAAGLLGMLVGRIPMQSLSALGRIWYLSMAAYIAYAWLSYVVGQTFLLQLSGAAIALGLIFGLAVNARADGWIQKRLIRLGQYSLFSYIAQIGILQILNAFAHRPDPLSPQFAILFLAALVLTVVFVDVVAWFRTKSLIIDSSYRTVFA